MPIVSQAEALPQAVQAVLELVQAGTFSRPDVLALMAPHARVKTANGIFSGGTEVTEAALATTRSLGLVVEARGVLRVVGLPAYPNGRAYRNAIRTGVFATERQFAGAIHWFYRQDAYRVPPERKFGDYQHHDEFQAIVSNETQFDNFRRWALYLGLIQQQWVSSGRVLLPDPTQALEDVWPEVAAGLGRHVSAPKLVEAILDALPVIDSSQARQLGGALSFALIGLERMSQLVFKNESDAECVTLTLPASVRDISSVELTEVKTVSLAAAVKA